MANRKITEVYLDQERWNDVCQATIPAAWVAVVDGVSQAIGYPWDFKNVEEATKFAREHFN